MIRDTGQHYLVGQQLTQPCKTRRRSQDTPSASFLHPAPLGALSARIIMWAPTLFALPTNYTITGLFVLQVFQVEDFRQWPRSLLS
jgi:hypothetical protein